jgi:hypothetical protein
MKLTNRGERVLGAAFVIGLLAMLGIAGAIETQPNPTCEDYQASQDWQRALHNDCPFQDNNGNYLYTWEPTN